MWNRDLQIGSDSVFGDMTAHGQADHSWAMHVYNIPFYVFQMIHYEFIMQRFLQFKFNLYMYYDDKFMTSIIYHIFSVHRIIYFTMNFTFYNEYISQYSKNILKCALQKYDRLSTQKREFKLIWEKYMVIFLEYKNVNDHFCCFHSLCNYDDCTYDCYLNNFRYKINNYS